MPPSRGANGTRGRRPRESTNESAQSEGTRTPPCNVKAEESLLGACILDGGRDTLSLCLEAKLPPEAFFKPANAIIYRELIELYEKGEVVDELLLADRLGSRTLDTLPGRERDPEGQRNLLEYIGGEEAVGRLTSQVETTVFAEYWLNLIKEKYLLRRLIGTATEIVERCYTNQDQLDIFIDHVEQEVFRISQDRVTDTARSARYAVETAEKMIQNYLQNRRGPQGVPSGFQDLDRLTFGFQKGEMIVLAARPSMGKTSLAMNFAEYAILPPDQNGYRTLVYSLEMQAEALAMRLLCCRARVNSENVRSGFASKEDQRKLYEAAQELKSDLLLIDDSTNLSILELRAKARRLHARNPLSLVIVDYLQLISGTDSRVPREQQISEISRGIKAMSKELSVPVIVLSQLNRDSEREKRAPRLSDLRESGAIEQDADVVLLLYSRRDRERDEEQDDLPDQASDTRELMIAKNRNGPVGTVPLTFIRRYTRFENHAQPTT